MVNKNIAVLGIPFLVLFVLGLGSLFVVTETEQALVLQFGELVDVVRAPGLKVKMPFVQDVVFYDKRILDFDIPTTEVTLGDQKRIVVDTFTRYRIQNPAAFYKTVRDVERAQGRLSALITGKLRSVLGQASLTDLLSVERSEILKDIRNKVNDAVKKLGIEVVDVRIRRADLPPENSQAIYQRMISERQKEAQKIRSEGKEKAQVIQAEADFESTVLIAHAEQKSQEEMGAGDQESLDILGQAYAEDPDFAAFYQSLEAYRSSLKKDARFILSPNSQDFLKYLERGASGKAKN